MPYATRRYKIAKPYSLIDVDANIFGTILHVMKCMENEGIERKEREDWAASVQTSKNYDEALGRCQAKIEELNGGEKEEETEEFCEHGNYAIDCRFCEESE